MGDFLADDSSEHVLLSDSDESSAFDGSVFGATSTPRDAERWSRRQRYAALSDGTTVIDADDQPVEAFMVELERMMLTGHSRVACRQWAKTTHGLDLATYRRYESIIQATWKLEGTTHYAITQRRDELRAMYREIYFRAMSPNQDVEPNLIVALKTVDSMAKLDGLAMPDVAVQINQSVGTDGTPNTTTTQLTNRTRERTMELLRLARERAEKHAEKTTRALTTSREESVEQYRVPQMGVVK